MGDQTTPNPKKAARAPRPRVVIELKPGTGVPYEDDAGASFDAAGVGSWGEFKSRFPGCRLSRVFRSLTPAQLARLESRARARDPRYRPGRSSRFFAVHVPGDVSESHEAGKLIRQTGIPTRIPAGWACFSACNFMFMGGAVRFVDPTGFEHM